MEDKRERFCILQVRRSRLLNAWSLVPQFRVLQLPSSIEETLEGSEFFLVCVLPDVEIDMPPKGVKICFSYAHLIHGLVLAATSVDRVLELSVRWVTQMRICDELVSSGFVKEADPSPESLLRN